MISRGVPSASRFEKYLATQEHVLYTCRRHPIVIVRPATLWLVILVAGALVGLVLTPEESSSLIDRVAGWTVLAATFYAGWKIALWWTARYVITDLRVLLVEGILSRRVAAIPLAKVTDTSYRRSLLGRILGYGDLMLDSPGETPGLAVLTGLPRPNQMYQLIMSLVVGGAGSQPPPPHLRDPDETGRIPRVTR